MHSPITGVTLVGALNLGQGQCILLCNNIVCICMPSKIHFKWALNQMYKSLDI